MSPEKENVEIRITGLEYPGDSYYDNCMFRMSNST